MVGGVNVTSDAQAFAAELDRLATWLRRHVRNEHSSTTITALDRLTVEGPLRVSELARREAMTQPGVTLLVNRLAEADLAERVPDPTDRRASLVRITPAGRRALAERQGRRAEVLRERMSCLTPDEQQQLLAVLPLLARLAGNPTEQS
jgi:DNA-binding MarR family transcriptional regulator